MLGKIKSWNLNICLFISFYISALLTFKKGIPILLQREKCLGRCDFKKIIAEQLYLYHHLFTGRFLFLGQGFQIFKGLWQ